jgi:hypothetical protein
MPATAPVAALAGAARDRFGPATLAVLFYGSCRRTEQVDGLFDLYVLLDGYRSLPFVERQLARVLPPNVYYLEAPFEGARLRSKCTVISLVDFERGTSRWFHSYLWARFAQPTTLAWTRDPQARERVEAALEHAIRTFVAQASALVPDDASPSALWITGLAASYGTELRSESEHRARELYEANAAWFDAVTGAARGSSGAVREHRAPAIAPTTAWRIRRVTGKLLSLARVLKSAYTFDGGLDYLVWKLERHSGRHIDVPERVRRAPAIHMWGFFWRLYREGVFR